MAGIPKTVRNVTVSTVLLLIMLVGGGLAYTYFLGPDNETVAAVPPVPAARPVIKPAQPAADANVGVSVSTLTSPVAAGSNAGITIKTLAGAGCKIGVVYADVAGKDSGLTPKTADEFGTASWTWTIGAEVPAGTWPVTVTCERNGKSALVKADLEVTR